MERAITFPSGDIRLEGRLYRGRDENGAVIAHPHPQMGGDMDDRVVKLAADACRQAGWTTLRFNFRGTGQSEGLYDNGNGEQLDLQAAVDRLQSIGCRRIEALGYSFGAWIIARWARRNPSPGQGLVLISPPVDLLEFDSQPIPGLRHVIAGERDAFAPPGRIEHYLERWAPGAALHIVPAADHFFAGCGRDLRAALDEAVNSR